MERKIRSKLEDFDIEIKPTDLKYSIMQIPREHREKLPGYKLGFILESNVGPIITHLASTNNRYAKIGDALEGNYMLAGRLSGENTLGLRSWYEHNKIKIGNRVRIKSLEGNKRYQLRRLKRR